jgi:hypothetical protein
MECSLHFGLVGLRHVITSFWQSVSHWRINMNIHNSHPMESNPVFFSSSVLLSSPLVFCFSCLVLSCRVVSGRVGSCLVLSLPCLSCVAVWCLYFFSLVLHFYLLLLSCPRKDRAAEQCAERRYGQTGRRHRALPPGPRYIIYYLSKSNIIYIYI